MKFEWHGTKVTANLRKHWISLDEAATIFADALFLEYDFQSMTGGVRGKYADSYRQGVNIVKLDDDVSAAFPDAKAVNDALRSLIQEKGSDRERGQINLNENN